MKPGYMTTEFWLTLLLNGAAIAVVFGVVNQEQADSLTAAAPQIATLLVMVAGGVVTTIRYIASRESLKKGE